jgi:hypothetical protein
VVIQVARPQAGPPQSDSAAYHSDRLEAGDRSRPPFSRPVIPAVPAYLDIRPDSCPC